MSETEVQDSGTNEEEARSALKGLLASVPANPAEVKFPSDKWGFTAGLRREALKVMATVRGNEEKHEILVATLAILLQHAHVRLPKDKELHKELLERRAAAAQGRAVREVYGSSLVEPTRVHTGPINVEE